MSRHFRTDGLNKRRGIEYPPRSPDWTPHNFLNYLKNKVYATKSNTLEQLKIAIEEKRHTITRETIIEVCNFMLWRCDQCLAVEGRQFEHLQWRQLLATKQQIQRLLRFVYLCISYGVDWSLNTNHLLRYSGQDLVVNPGVWEQSMFVLVAGIRPGSKG